MRLHSVTVRNYRLHRDLTVRLDPERTLIGGANETGKSTLVEAIHRALFLRAKGNTDAHRAMESTLHPGKPEVELEFEADGTTYHLHKRFSGTNGTVRLAGYQGAVLNGDEAEEALARLLRVEPAGNANVARQQWAHVWVWQGLSGDDPATHANEQKDALLQRLGQNGSAATLMQSELDARMAERFATACGNLFTTNGTPKAGSELARLNRELEEAQSAEATAADRLARLQEAITAHASATTDLSRLEKDGPELQRQQSALTVRQNRLNELSQTETAQAHETRDAQAKLTALQQIDTKIRELATEIEGATAALAPRTTELEQLKAAAATAREASAAALSAYDGASDHVRRCRQEHDLAKAALSLREKQTSLAQLQSRVEQVAAIDQTIATLRDRLAKLPPISPAQVKDLRKRETDHAAAAATLEGMAAGIEVLDADQPVRLGDSPLPPHTAQIITEDTVLTIGASTRIRIRPGGGTGLAQARRNEQEARTKLRALLDELHVADSAAAQEIVQQRADLDRQIEAETKRRADHGADTLPDLLAKAAEERTATENELARCAAALDRPFPAVTADEDLDRPLAAAARALQDAETAEQKARIRREAAAKTSLAAEDTHTKAHGALEKDRKALQELESRQRLLLEQHGNTETRQKHLAEVTTMAQAASERLATTRHAIAELQPELLPADLARLKRSLDAAQRARQDAETKRAVAESTLLRDGTTDPQADLEAARARLENTMARRASVSRRAEAIQLLDGLFKAEQQALADQFTRPLVEKVSGYIQCLFGAGARIELRFEEQSFGPPSLVRPGDGRGAIAFAELSGGTKEQVAAAMRLALAEVLAADHGGCLPVVFDDAFAFSDPDRVQTLQRMLDLAATRGLQVIVLTCTPSDYRALGAHECPLTPPVRVAAEARTHGNPNPSPDGESTADTPANLGERSTGAAPTGPEAEQFLAALRARGGSSGNGALREALGWDETTYDEVKLALLAAGTITPGRGRGGSVAIRAECE